MDKRQALAFLHDMLLGRRFEERCAEEYMKGNIAGFLHLYPGEEAVAVGVIHACETSDYIVSTYREHVHALVRGVPAGEVMAELFGKRGGCSRGMGGSMHLFDPQRRFMGGYAIVGETYPVAIGLGYGIAMKDLPEAVICFFGDGAVNQGTFHESLNMAALWKLPVLFVCENNQYAIGTEIHRHSAVPEVYKRAAAYRIPAERVDGMDVLEVHRATEHALQQIRAGSGPQLLECLTYRFRGHSMADPGHYRPPVEVKAHQQTDPLELALRELSLVYPTPEQIAAAGPDALLKLRQYCFDQGHLHEEGFEELERQVQDEVEAAVQFALEAPEPTLDDAWQALYCNRRGEILI
ncbi:pyruvate dehydrogenase E1 component alpha subunit [Methylomarinovum tepidoasis]|uniref:Pyruvate dehydrogenase E1 component alpha subunit n=1 Tax=Methylomarinovum tepidoasis TaxID=2840183 RepID=A0AAU9CCI9_9GAMM|nr:thiamine pyrophosphate-dependent enzyme [Methylomarinovum sp. IN45]BCX89687.1 pyruvate dehydrogenase E1 component alpha subunit [Methylomarinovum sp. IN45]